MPVAVGKKAPAFTLPDQDGREHALKDYAGKWVILFFYPKDNTPGCTMEAKAFRDSMPKFRRNKIVPLGVSTDSIKSHRKFCDKFELPFTLLADEDKKVVNAYGVWGKKKFMGREFMGTKRWSFLIDPQGKVAKIYDKVKPKDHADEVLADYKELK